MTPQLSSSNLSALRVIQTHTRLPPQQLNHPNVIKYLASFVENNEVRDSRGILRRKHWLSCHHIRLDSLTMREYRNEKICPEED